MKSDGFWKPYRGAVSLTFDDGNPSQLALAIPAMDALGFKGTFYLNPRAPDWRRRLAPWKAVAAAGHEIGNHTLSHTCSRNFGFAPRGLEDMTADEIERDILAAQERLVLIAPLQRDWTFAYPCYQTFIGRGASRQSYVPVVARHFLAGRAGGEHGFANHPRAVDLHAAWGVGVELMSGFEMIGMVEDLAARGRWVILVFHEFNGHRLTVAMHDFQLLLDYLHRRRKEVWTAPMAEVAGKIARARRWKRSGCSPSRG
ncbi:MAG: polysaccharide deacetylase family protein [Phycisphaerae bacterium]